MAQKDSDNRKKKKKKSKYRLSGGIRALLVVVVILAIICVVFLVYALVSRTNSEQGRLAEQRNAAEQEEIEAYEEESEEDLVEEEIAAEPEPEPEPEPDPEETALEEAALLAEMYDYDGAISTLQDSGYYETNTQMQEAAASYQAQKDACVAWEPEQVTHIFYHTLIVDPAKAFDGDEDSGGYNQYMCTIDEFNKINQTMYEEGYVMVSMHDMCTVNDDGTVDPKTIYLPEGKTPYVLSQDDVSYYHYMSGDGFATKLVLDENGEVKNEYIEDDGTVSVGDYDLVPLIDAFVEEHPDACYHGHKGTIALTGYEGVLGYRTDEVYRTREEDRLTRTQREFFEDNPDFDEDSWQEEVDQATAVADAMKEEGWEFASHTWGHIDPIAKGYNTFVQDTDRWLENVEPIVGYTDIIIFAFGADVTDGDTPYAEDNEFFRYLKDVGGFNIFCLVDSSQYFVQFNGTSMRMGRRDIDGYRLYYTPEKVTDLFNVDDVWDDTRPTPVPEI